MPKKKKKKFFAPLRKLFSFNITMENNEIFQKERKIPDFTPPIKKNIF